MKAEEVIISREVWGSKDLVYPTAIQKLKYITIHHSGEIFNSGKDVAQYLRNLQSWSIKEKNWIDIPYHYLIDLTGKIYEARPLNIAGDTNTNYDPEGHILISLLGNYEVQQVNSAQLKALSGLIATLAEKHKIPLDKIASHKDYSDETVCPGKNLYDLLKNDTLVKLIKPSNP